MKDKLLKDLENLSILDLRSICLELGVSYHGNKKNIIKKLLHPLNRKYKMNEKNVITFSESVILTLHMYHFKFNIRITNKTTFLELKTKISEEFKRQTKMTRELPNHLLFMLSQQKQDNKIQYEDSDKVIDKLTSYLSNHKSISFGNLPIGALDIYVLIPKKQVDMESIVVGNLKTLSEFEHQIQASNSINIISAMNKICYDSPKDIQQIFVPEQLFVEDIYHKIFNIFMYDPDFLNQLVVYEKYLGIYHYKLVNDSVINGGEDGTIRIERFSFEKKMTKEK